KDIEGFSYIYLIYHFHQAEEPKLTLKPFLEDALRGVFATRAPRRPNPIGLSIVKLLKRENNILYFEGADILNQTPLIDIKPYSAKFDVFNPAKNGWQDNINDDDAQIKGRRNYKK
ncbi:MAG: tRNA (N6-threonylcarbamoyladenosine(37)-N6)-methyltransferase TrmO, partial [Alphaproteobacteria bacterium]